jgi:hypothetical protein
MKGKTTNLICHAQRGFSYFHALRFAKTAADLYVCTKCGYWHAEDSVTLTPLTGKWRTRCAVCGKEYENRCGSTECCGAIQEIIEETPSPKRKTK